MKRWLLALWFLLPLSPLVAQPSHVGVAFAGGRVIPVNGSRYDGNSPTLGVDVSLAWQQEKEIYWHRFWQHPFVGVRGNYAHVFNGIAGDRFVLAGFLQAPVYKNLHWVYSVGLSFYTQPYKRTHDIDNEFIGSYTNCLIDLGFLYNVPCGNGNALFMAAKLEHSSNGYLYKPNHGLNYVQAELGFRFRIRPSAAEQPGYPLPAPPLSFAPSLRPYLSFAPGLVMSRNDAVDDIHYYCAYTFQAGVIRHPHPCLSYGGGLDLSYNFAHQALAPADEWPVYPAVSLFGESHWGPITLRLGLAHYLAYYPQNWEQYYERVGLYYRFGDRHRRRVGVAMKVHYDHVDYVEWTYAIEL